MIPTQRGFVTLSDIHIGDSIFGIDGRPCLVLAESDVITAPAFRLTFDDGSEIDAHDDHLWLTFDARELAGLTRLDPEWRARRRKRRASRSCIGAGIKTDHSPEHRTFLSSAITERNRLTAAPKLQAPTGTVRTTADIVATLRTERGRTNHAIPVADAIEIPEKSLLLDPYILGVWLGDGTTSSGTITTMDRPIVRSVVNAGFPVAHVQRKADNRAATYRFDGLRAVLKAMGLLGNKTIPHDYLWASRDQRLALLQGLLDTDGGVEDGQASFTNTKRNLVEGVAHLVRSLGMKASVREGIAKLNGRVIGPKWVVKFTANVQVFRLKAKARKMRLATRRTTRFRYVVNAKRIDAIPMKCLRVDSPDRLFLAGEHFIPTHNSDFLLGTSATRHLRSIIFRREAKQGRSMIDRSRELFTGRGRFNETFGIWRGLPGGRQIEFAGVKDPSDVLNWRGQPHDFIGIDEADAFLEGQVRFLFGWLRTTVVGQQCQAVICFNPPATAEGRWLLEFFGPWIDRKHERPAVPGELRWYATPRGGVEMECEDGEPFEHAGEFLKPTSRTFFPASVRDNPYLMATDYVTRLQSLPEPLRSQLLYGDMEAGLEDDAWQIIPTEWVKLAQKRWTPEPPIDCRRISCLGVDVARGGKDKTSLAARHRNWFAPVVSYAGKMTPDGDEVVARIVKALNTEQQVPVNVDIIGIGSAVYDTGRRMGLLMRAINFAEGTDRRDRAGVVEFANVRAACYWLMRESLDPQKGDNIALPPDDELLAELTAPRFSLKARGILVESKEEITKRVGRSPDKADAVVLANYLIGGTEMPTVIHRQPRTMFHNRPGGGGHGLFGKPR